MFHLIGISVTFFCLFCLSEISGRNASVGLFYVDDLKRRSSVRRASFLNELHDTTGTSIDLRPETADSTEREKALIHPNSIVSGGTTYSIPYPHQLLQHPYTYRTLDPGKPRPATSPIIRKSSRHLSTGLTCLALPLPGHCRASHPVPRTPVRISSTCGT